MVTDPDKHKTHDARSPDVANTQTGPITIHCAAKLSAQCNNTDNTMYTVYTKKVSQMLNFHQFWRIAFAINA